MKSLLFLFVFAITFLGSVSSLSTCDHVDPMVPQEWLTMVDGCQKRMIEQVQTELNAAMTYLAMGAHFSRDDVNRPGFAKFFFESASEEREHAIKIISYLLMRTNPQDYLSDLINEPKPLENWWENGVFALENALRLEANVTVSIRRIIDDCQKGVNSAGEPFDDFHLVDYLSGDFLEEQYKGQRELAGMISTLKKMIKDHYYLGEYLFDKKLLNNELF